MCLNPFNQCFLAIMIIISLGEPRVITFFRVSPIHCGRFCISFRAVVPTFYLRVQDCVWVFHRQKRMTNYRAQSLVMFDFFKGKTNFSNQGISIETSQLLLLFIKCTHLGPCMSLLVLWGLLRPIFKNSVYFFPKSIIATATPTEIYVSYMMLVQEGHVFERV